MVAAIGILILIVMNVFHVTRVAVYILVGVIVWVAVLKSGIHATLAGTVVGLCIPLYSKDKNYSPLRNLEHALHPWVAFCILPLFILMNAGVPFLGTSISSILSMISVAIALGLFVGKQLGIFMFAWFAIKLKFARLPKGTTWLQFYAACVLCGVGFTMSVFISDLAFANTPLEITAKQGVLIGSFLSAILGVSLFLITGKPKTQSTLSPNFFDE